MWLNLTDGQEGFCEFSLGDQKITFLNLQKLLCGRKNWDGSGGNGHALEHFNETKYPLCVKLGTITKDGADVFSYAEDDMVTDPYLEKVFFNFDTKG